MTAAHAPERRDYYVYALVSEDLVYLFLEPAGLTPVFCSDDRQTPRHAASPWSISCGSYATLYSAAGE